MSLSLHTDPVVQAAEEIRELIAEANELEEPPWALTPTAILRDYLPQSELAGTVSSDLKITVMPGLDGDEEPLNRSAIKLTFAIAIAVERKPATYSVETLDELCGFTEDLMAFLRKINLPCGAKHTGLSKAVPRYSWRHLQKSRTFVAIRRLYFEIALQATRHT